MKYIAVAENASKPPARPRESTAGGLVGKRVVITRAAEKAGEVEIILKRYGAVPVPYPCIEILFPDNSQELDNALVDAATGTFDWLVVTSANAATSIGKRLSHLGITLGDIAIAAIGPATAQTIEQALDRPADFTASKFIAEALANELELTAGQRILLPQSEIARPVLAERLSERGAMVTEVMAYKTSIGHGGDDVPTMLAAKEIDAVIFTSASTVHFFLARLREKDVGISALEDICLAAIGPVTAKALQAASLRASLIPDSYTIPALIDALDKHYVRVN